MTLIIGLGNHDNAEEKYGRALKGTRHNAGYELLMHLHRDLAAAPMQKSQGGMQVNATFDALNITLYAPCKGDLNSSGDDLKLDYPDPDTPLLVLLDDLDLPPGTLRYRKSGSSGGHLGLENILNHYRTVSRIRYGIGRPHAGKSVLNHVMSMLSEDEHAQMHTALPQLHTLIRTHLTRTVQ